MHKTSRKIKLKGILQPYVDYDSLKSNLKMKIKKSFNDFVLNDLALSLIKNFEDIKLKEMQQIESYEVEIKELKDYNKNIEVELAIFRLVTLGLVIIVIFLIASYIWFIKLKT